MVFSDETVSRARQGEPRAVQELLSAASLSVWRIGAALTGSAAAADRLTSLVLQQSIDVMGGWRDGVSPENWYYHHTVLRARSIAIPGGQRIDPLIPGDFASDASYRAWVSALRALPSQQREALILHHGERLNVRLLGVAMDCSASAAQVHLDSAESTLARSVGADQDALLARFIKSYAQLSPPQGVLRLSARQAGRARRGQFVHWLWRRVLFLLFLAGLIAAGLHWKQTVVGWLDRLRALDVPATRPANG